MVTKADFQSEHTLKNLEDTLNNLMKSGIVPILNTNDAISSPPEKDQNTKEDININDNDSLAAKLASMVKSDLLLLLSDVDGVYNKPPSEPGSRLINSFNPCQQRGLIAFGEKSNVGTGGMESKIKAAEFALNHDCNVIICNGERHNAISDSIEGKKVGTFFTSEGTNVSIESLAINGKHNFKCFS